MDWVLTLAASMVIAGALRAFLASKGWWPDWEKLDLEKQQERKLLRAYKKWRKDAGPEAAAQLGVALDRFTDRPSDSGAVEESTR